MASDWNFKIAELSQEEKDAEEEHDRKWNKIYEKKEQSYFKHFTVPEFHDIKTEQEFPIVDLKYVPLLPGLDIFQDSKFVGMSMVVSNLKYDYDDSEDVRQAMEKYNIFGDGYYNLPSRVHIFRNARNMKKLKVVQYYLSLLPSCLPTDLKWMILEYLYEEIRLFSHNGKIFRMNQYFNDIEEGICFSQDNYWYKEDHVGTYRNGKLNGLSVTYYENSLAEVVMIKNDVFHGTMIYFRQNRWSEYKDGYEVMVNRGYNEKKKSRDDFDLNPIDNYAINVYDTTNKNNMCRCCMGPFGDNPPTYKKWEEPIRTEFYMKGKLWKISTLKKYADESDIKDGPQKPNDYYYRIDTFYVRVKCHLVDKKYDSWDFPVYTRYKPHDQPECLQENEYNLLGQLLGKVYKEDIPRDNNVYSRYESLVSFHGYDNDTM